MHPQSTRPHRLVSLLLPILLLAAMPATATIDLGDLLPIAKSEVQVSLVRKSFDRRTGETRYRATLTNRSPGIIAGPNYLALQALEPNRADVANADAVSTTGEALFQYDTLLPGQSLTRTIVLTSARPLPLIPFQVKRLFAQTLYTTRPGPVTPEGRLVGPPTAPALEHIADYDQGETYNPAEMSRDALGIEVNRTHLEVDFHADVEVGEINAVLAAYDARITVLLEGVAAVVVRIPDPGTLEALEQIRARMEGEPGVFAVRLAKRDRVPASLPPNYEPPEAVLPTQRDKLDHHLAVRAHAAWNARAALRPAPERPLVVVADFYGDGPPNADMDVADLDTDYQSGATEEHGYHVMGTIAARFGGAATDRGFATGLVPETLSVRGIDYLNAPDDATFLARVIQAIRGHAGNVVLNTSLQFLCNTPATAAANCNPVTAASAAADWLKRVRGEATYLTGASGPDSLEHQFLHLTAAGNIAVAGDTDATVGSEYSAATLRAGLTAPENGLPLANLTNTLVIENRINTTDPAQVPRPACLDNSSKFPGTLSGIGEDVWSFTDAGTSAGNLTGTSMATPQVAGLAAYLWSIDPTLSVQQIKDRLRDTARPLPLAEVDITNPDCNITQEPTPVIDAYAAVLALDLPVDAFSPLELAPVRLALFDVEGGDGAFTEQDLSTYEAQLGEPAFLVSADYSRYDLNGDAYTGGSATERFDLDIDGAYGRVAYTFNSQPATLDENELTDLQILCYYAYSPLYTGDEEARDDLLAADAELCGAGVGGKIAFQRGDEIFVMNADGSGQTRLTHAPGNDPDPINWSPDGSRIAFVSTRDGHSEIYVINVDGSGQANLTNAPGSDFSQTWSPDGSRIAFVSDRDGDYEIYVMNADGSGQTNITSAPGLDIAPKWSPDGSRIVFESDRNGISEIYVMNADGSGQKNLTTALSDGSNAPGETDADPTWSPDSSRIAFWSERDGNQDIYNQDVYVMKADGSERRRLTDDPAGDNSPRWQPTPAP